MRPLAALALAALIATPVDENPAIRKAESEYTTAVATAEGRLAEARRSAEEKRLKVYNTELQKATRTGDFDAAAEIKRRIETYESEGARPRPETTAKFGRSEYALITGEPATWHVAKQRCEQMGGHLVCCESPAELAFVTNLCGNSSAWLGATDEEREGEWIWVNGKPFEGPRPWADNAQEAEHYLAIWERSRSLNDWIGGLRLFYVCEWE